MDFYAICSGRTPIRTRWDGARMIEGSALRSVLRWLPNSFTNTTWILSAELTRLLKTVTSFFAKRQLVTLFSAPNYCGEFDNAGAMMSVDETLMCSFQILKPADKRRYPYGMNIRPITPPRAGQQPAQNNSGKRK